MRRREEPSRLRGFLILAAAITFAGPLVLSAQEKAESPPPGVRVVNAPDLKVGDTWVLDNKLESHTKRVIKGIKGDRMIVEVDAGEREMNLEWGVFEGGRLDPISYSPVFQLMPFPVWQGKTWSYPYTETRSTRRGLQKEKWVLEGKAEVWERVTVPAGTFEALRIKVKYGGTRLGAGGRAQGGEVNATLWYAPEVNFFVKRVSDSRAVGGDHELVSYQRAK